MEIVVEGSDHLAVLGLDLELRIVGVVARVRVLVDLARLLDIRELAAHHDAVVERD